MRLFREDEGRIRDTTAEVLGLFMGCGLYPSEGYLVTKALQYVLEECGGYRLADEASSRRLKRVAGEALDISPGPEGRAPRRVARRAPSEKGTEKDRNLMYG